MAAWAARDSFTGRSTRRTWLIGILHHKIVDYFRSRTRRKASESTTGEQIPSDIFDARGRWQATIAQWPRDPADVLQDREFHEILEQCCRKLPPPLAEAFRLREIEALTTDEICKILDISQTNLAVRVHRARLLLRKCLEANWFSKR